MPPVRRGASLFVGRTVISLVLVCVVSLLIGCDILRSDLRRLAGKSDGTLVANIGMPLAEVQGHSTLQLAASVHYPTGEELSAANARFDFEVAGTNIRFPGCRYYWLMTGEHNNARLNMISVGTSAKHLNVDELAAAFTNVAQRLRQDGWLQGHLHMQPPPQFVPPNKLPWGNLFAWAKGDTLMLLRDKRMDDEKPGEDEHSGEFILYVELYPRAYEHYKHWEF
jgi:hypothetical protein